MQDADPLLPVAVVAGRFRVAPVTVTRWLRLGKLTGLRTPGGQWRVRASEVEAFLRAREGTGNER